MIQRIKDWTNNNPKIARLNREGGLVVIVCNVITIFKAIALMFLPDAFGFLGT